MTARRMTAPEARSLLRRLVEEGKTGFSPHAKKEMAKDGLIAPDVIQILRGGAIDEPEYENGSWRYRARAQRVTVIVMFDGEDDEEPDEVLVVTVWKVKT